MTYYNGLACSKGAIGPCKTDVVSSILIWSTYIGSHVTLAVNVSYRYYSQRECKGCVYSEVAQWFRAFDC